MSSAGPLRLTIDQRLTTLATDVIEFSNHGGSDILPGQGILELKYVGGLPILFERLIDDFHLTPRSMSKYRLAVRALGLATEPEGMLAHA
jgi:hypothetical protein